MAETNHFGTASVTIVQVTKNNLKYKFNRIEKM